MIKLIATVLLIAGCSHGTKSVGPNSGATVDIAMSEESPTTSNNFKQPENFNLLAIKANRKKNIFLYVDDLRGEAFCAVGVIKWLERHGYKIGGAHAEGFGQLLLVPFQEKKKTSYLEWKLHQWSKEDFPLQENSDVENLVLKLKNKFNISQDDSAQGLTCDDFALENQNNTVICVLKGSQDKVLVGHSATGMELIKLEIAPDDFSSNASLVDHIERGFNLAQKLKNAR